MTVNEVLMIVMAIGAVIGGADYLLGNRFGLGAKFAEGFKLLGSLALSMAGIICLAPVLAELLAFIRPVFLAIGIDPAILGSVLAIDMGGYQLATGLAEDPLIGEYAGIVAAATFGCTLVFTIPVGMGAIGEADKPYFARGLLIGLIALPVSLFVGAWTAGLTLIQSVVQNLPILLISVLLLIGLIFIRDKLVRMFAVFARGLEIVTIIGLILAIVQHLTGFTVLRSLAPLETAMKEVSAIGIVMAGGIPLAELLSRALKRPLRKLGERTGMNATATAALLVGTVSETAALFMIKDMDRRGQVVNAAFLVCSASAFAAHLGLAMSVSPTMVVPMLAGKMAGGIAAVVLAMRMTKRMNSEE